MDFFAWQDNRTQRISQLVEIEDRNALNLSDAMQVVIVGEDLSAAFLREPDQLAVNVALLRRGRINDLNPLRKLLPQTLERIETAAASRPAEMIVRVGDSLQFIEHKSRHKECRIEEAGA
ncbi:MAG: hypothetical protein C4345_07815 [Chloroflexota bacterium]